MTEKIISLLSTKYRVTPIDIGSDAVRKVKPMTFNISQYNVEGVGNLSVMKGSALFGLMKMDTLILTPSMVDAPLLSYDRIMAMGNDTLIFEFYNTMLDDKEPDYVSSMNVLKEDKKLLKNIPVHDLGAHWYDPIKHEASVSHRGKKCADTYSKYIETVINDYMKLLSVAKLVDSAEKKEKSAQYVNGLFEHGGPSTDAFIKGIGKEETVRIFEDIIFGIKK